MNFQEAFVYAILMAFLGIMAHLFLRPSKAQREIEAHRILEKKNYNLDRELDLSLDSSELSEFNTFRNNFITQYVISGNADEQLNHLEWFIQDKMHKYNLYQ